MKHLILMFLFYFEFRLNAQQSKSDNVKSTIQEFFDAFLKQDTTNLKSMVTDKVILYAIATNKEEYRVLKENDFNKFLIPISNWVHLRLTVR